MLKKVIDDAPLLEVTDEDKTLHQLWRVSQGNVLKEVSLWLKDSPLFIADGHHRYETALNYRNLEFKKHPESTGKESYNYVMMYLTSMEAAGLVIMPYHRVIQDLKGFDFPLLHLSLEDPGNLIAVLTR